MNRLPPYGKKLVSVISKPETWPQYMGTSPDGSRLTFWIAIGPAAWEWAGTRLNGFLVSVIPENANPEAFKFNFTKGHDPILVQQCGDSPAEYVKSLIYALMRDGVKRVMLMGENGTTLFRNSYE